MHALFLNKFLLNNLFYEIYNKFKLNLHIQLIFYLNFCIFLRLV